MMLSNLDTLIDRWISDPAFRTAMRVDPAAAARAVGVSLTVEQRDAMQLIDWGQSDGQLTDRISKDDLWGRERLC